MSKTFDHHADRLLRTQQELERRMERAAKATGMVRESVGALRADRMECERLTRLLLKKVKQ